MKHTYEKRGDKYINFGGEVVVAQCIELRFLIPNGVPGGVEAIIRGVDRDDVRETLAEYMDFLKDRCTVDKVSIGSKKLGEARRAERG